MEFLYLLENLRIPVINEFMLFITHFGAETAFLVVALIFFWCVDKRKGYYILVIGFIGTIINQFMKLWFRIPRPWIADSNFTILESARAEATGYSFPSGHTQNAVGTFGAIAITTKNHRLKLFAILVAILVPFSRMYVGVHTPLDVFVAAGIAIALIFMFKPLVYDKDKYMLYILIGMLALAILFLLFVIYYPFPIPVNDAMNVASGNKNAFTLLGAMIGLLVAYIVDKKWIQFSERAVWWAQTIKVVIGLLLVLVVKSGLDGPLAAVFGQSIGRAIRYFLIVIVAGILWPLSFKWFSRLGNKEK